MKKLFFILCLMFSFSSSFVASNVNGNIYEMNGIKKELIQELPDDNIENYWYNEKYFKPTYTYTKKWSSIASKAKRGDFLAIDRGIDGTYDHIGYVTEKRFNNVWELKIAQHTSNYNKYNHGWASECNKNKCSIIRR